MAVRVVWFPIWHTLTTKTCLGHRPNQLCLKRPHDREATCFCSLMCEKVEFLNHAASESSRYVGPIWSQVWNECTLHDACTTIAAVILPNSDVRKKGTKVANCERIKHEKYTKVETIYFSIFAARWSKIHLSTQITKAILLDASHPFWKHLLSLPNWCEQTVNFSINHIHA